MFISHDESLQFVQLSIWLLLPCTVIASVVDVDVMFVSKTTLMSALLVFLLLL